MKRVVLVPGDGIGPEITEAARKAVDATGAEIEWQLVDAGAKTIEHYGRPLSPKFFPMARDAGVVLKGPVTTPVGTGFRSVNVTIRERLNLFANVRFARTIPGVKALHEGVDIILVRENTEGMYVGVERESTTGIVESIKLTSATASKRIVRFAFDLAESLGRKNVTALHKANILKVGDGLFLRCAREVAEEYPQIGFNDLIVDNAAYQMVIRPQQFDVVVAQNLYGDIVSDLAAGLIGGLALMPGANFGEKVAVFEAAHGSAPDIAGQGVANPAGIMLSAAWMLTHMELVQEGEDLRNAIYKVLGDGKHLTPDMGGQGTTDGFADAVIAKLERA
jgi:isocitrate dehydrogenase (NAD+)